MTKLTDAEKDLAGRNEKLAHMVAQKFKGRCSIEYDDLVSIGYLGLVTAAKKFDPARGYKFSTFAARCIEMSILHELRKQKAPKRHNPNIETVSLDATAFRDSETTLGEVVPDPRNCFDIVEKREAVKSILHGCALSPKERQAICLIVMDGLKQRIACSLMGTSQSLVSRYAKSGVLKIRNSIGGGKKC